MHARRATEGANTEVEQTARKYTPANRHTSGIGTAAPETKLLSLTNGRLKSTQVTPYGSWSTPLRTCKHHDVTTKETCKNR